MRNTKESLPTGGRWWYYAYLMIAGLLFCLCLPLQVSADSKGAEKSHVALVIDAQETGTSSDAGDKGEAMLAEGRTSQETQPAQLDRTATDRMLMHIFAVVFGGVLCVGLGVGVLIYHIRQDRADDIYVANIRRCYGELTVNVESQKQNIKENYGRRTVFIREKQA